MPFRCAARCTPHRRTTPVLLGGLVLAALAPHPVFAQQQPTATATQAPAPAAKTVKSAAPAAAPKAAKPENDAALKQRVENLEEQLVDMQVVVGTLESFAKSNGAASASPTYRAGSPTGDAPAVDTARLTGLESQVRSLTAQVQSLNEQIRTMGGQPRPAGAATAVVPAGVAPVVGGGFGTATVAPERSDPAESSNAGRPNTAVAAAKGGVSSEQFAPAAPSAEDQASVRQVYETAYGYLLQQDYGAAEVAFDDFLKRYPNDNLAGNAQFWLGESFFVRSQFKPAAAAFLKGYQSYSKSAKAPDSLLKLAMSLGKLGQKDAACSSFGELNTRFPAASADVKSRAAAEKQRTGCP